MLYHNVTASTALTGSSGSNVIVSSPFKLKYYYEFLHWPSATITGDDCPFDKLTFTEASSGQEDSVILRSRDYIVASCDMLAHYDSDGH